MSAEIAAASATVGLVLLRDGAVTWVNEAAEGFTTAHGGTWSGPASPEEHLAALRPGSGPLTVRWPSPSGGTRWWKVTAVVPRPAPDHVLYEITDETNLYEADGRDLGPPTAQWRLARMESMAGMGSWVWNIATGQIEWSEALIDRFAIAPGTRMDYESVRELVHPDDRDTVREALAQAVRDGRPFSYVSRMLVGRPAVERLYETNGEVICDAAGVPTRLFGTARDITEQHRTRAELAHLAAHDPLTGIANRRSITGWLAECAADPRESALLLVDIDNFKDINDLRGHATGDRVIRGVARTLATRLGAGAQLGRLGGDEFAVVVPGCGAGRAIELAEDLCDTVAASSVVEDASSVRITVSIGVATMVQGQDADTSLAQADLALYEAKNAGRNRARMFAVDHYRQAARRVSLLQRVGAALEDGSMQLDAQPIVDLATDRIDRYELLLRLRDGLEPALDPVDFLPAAERTDLVLRVDRWVMERAVQALASPRARAAGLRLEVNVSARSLEDTDLGSFVLDCLARADVDPRRLGLEITETTAIASLDAARVLADRLTRAGCGFTLDDFGAGFGSFSYLKNLPFTAVKIAGEFVRRLDADPVDRALVAGVVGVARQLGMRTVAEQVDRPALIGQLRDLGVDDAQGFHLGRPQPLGDLLGRR